MAVPGSPRSLASAGTNALIVDGAAPVLDPDDVLMALGLSTGRSGSAPADPRTPPDRGDQEILDLFGADPLDVEQVVALTDRSLADVAVALARLETAGWLSRVGGWFERLGAQS
jgi:predicted Rossmann fold nucleotide-binding protein DprA/Smf involved in DNA uptake